MHALADLTLALLADLRGVLALACLGIAGIIGAPVAVIAANRLRHALARRSVAVSEQTFVSNDRAVLTLRMNALLDLVVTIIDSAWIGVSAVYAVVLA
jgi:hypothetical protein